MENNEHNKQSNNSKPKEFHIIKRYLKTSILRIGNFLVKIGETDFNDENRCSDGSYDTSFVYNPVPNECKSGIQTVGKDSDFEKETPSCESLTREDNNDSLSHSIENVSGYKLLHKTAELINYYDMCAENSADDVSRALYNDASNKIIENLILSGCSAINPQEDEKFDFIYHTTRPIITSTERLILITKRLGVKVGDEVLIKAIVELK